MSWQDVVNGSFELAGGVAVIGHILKLRKDRQVKGVSWLATLFFSGWGFWNLYYYPHLNQWVSFVGGLAIVLGNSVWLGMMLYYTRKNKNNERVSATQMVG